MTDPERILDRPPSELAARLLRAGSDEVPSPRSLQRTLSAVGVGAAALGAAGSAGAFGAAKAATSLTLLALTKWAGIGAVGGIVVAAAAHGLAPPVQHGSALAPASAVHAPPPLPHVLAPAVASARSEPISPPAESEPPPRRSSPPASPAEALGAPLAAEVAFVDRGRAAFQHGQPAAALAALSSYEREFSEPRLLPEVLYLRMESSSRRGDRARATELARRIVRDYPRSPHAARARSVLGEP